MNAGGGGLYPGLKWDPLILCGLGGRLAGLSLLLPDNRVGVSLPAILRSQSHPQPSSARALSEPKENDIATRETTIGNLAEFSIICQSSPIVNNSLFLLLHPYLSGPQLLSLTLIGCPKLTNEPLLTLLSSSPNLSHLSLESVGITPTFFALASHKLQNLRSLTTTHPPLRTPQIEEFYPSISTLISTCPNFHSFTHYMTGHTTLPNGKREWPVLPASFIRDLREDASGSAGARRLRKFNFHGILAGMDRVEDVCQVMPNLRDFVCHIWEKDLVGPKSALGRRSFWC